MEVDSDHRFPCSSCMSFTPSVSGEVILPYIYYGGGFLFTLFKTGKPYRANLILTLIPFNTHTAPMVTFLISETMWAYIERCRYIMLYRTIGRTALLRGGYLWRIAVSEVSFERVLSGPSGLSSDPDEMIVVTLSMASNM